MEPLRNVILNRFDNLRYTAAETHKIEWESKKRTDELNELSISLHSLSKELNDERDNFLRLQTENTQLQEIKSHNDVRLHRINHMVEPIEHEVVFKENQRPETIQKYISTHEGTNSSKMFNNDKDGKRHYKNTNWHKTMDKNVSMNTTKKVTKGGLGGVAGGVGHAKSAKNIGRVSDGAALNDVPKKGE